MEEHASHPVFARVYARVAELSERRGGAEHRRKLLGGLCGRVVEVGAGSGTNFRHYPTSVSEVIAVEPERYLRERAQGAAAKAPVPVSVTHGDADRLPGEEESFDAGVFALVLCTVPDQHAALAELHRVIRLGGELRFYEHVAAHSGWEARFQRARRRDLLATSGGRLSFGARHDSRHRARGVSNRSVPSVPLQPRTPPNPHILGVARRR